MATLRRPLRITSLELLLRLVVLSSLSPSYGHACGWRPLPTSITLIEMLVGSRSISATKKREKNIMSILVKATQGMSPNVNSGLGAGNYAPGAGTFTGEGPANDVSGTGGSGNATAGSSTTITSHEVEVIPSTIPVPAITAGVAGVASGLSASPNPGASATSITNVVPDQNG
jgi:hypothetical protein